MTSKIEPPYYPIIYVRGYAGNDDEIEQTVADPYMGFNLGSTKFRQAWTGAVRRHYFESPLYRLKKDFDYTDVYSHGQDMPPDMEIPAKSIVIYRYYDEQFFIDLSGKQVELERIEGERREIEEFAAGLGRLILLLRDRICGDDADSRKAFRVYLVAHSMGGLVCRCFLQNSKVSSAEARNLVDRVVTYATPHNGIEMRLLGNVPNFFSPNNANNFNRERMKEYLALPKSASDVMNLKGKFNADRFFCLVGTNYRDYTVAGGWSQRLTGPMSDGLVRITNATVYDQASPSATRIQAPRAFIHRSHSGHYGIVNSEDGYQNLTRFLFGDVRVDGVLVLDELTLPPDVEKARTDGKDIEASYHFEVVVKVRGIDWDMHRRTSEEGSAIFRKFDEMFPKQGKRRNPYLFSAFLSSGARVNKRRRSLGFAVDLGVLVPEYTVAGSLWRDKHYSGSYLFRDTITIEASPVEQEDGNYSYDVRYGFDSRTPNRTTKTADKQRVDGSLEFTIPLQSKSQPGMSGKLLLCATSWK